MKSIQNPAAALVAAITPTTARRLLHRSVIQGVEVYCTKCGNHTTQPHECPTCKTGDYLDKGDCPC